MKKRSEHKFNLPEQAESHGFSVPDGYFESFESRLKEKISGKQEPEKRETERKLFGVNPYFRLAAAIAGIALVSFTIIRIILGSASIEQSYDLAFLEETGILNESGFHEAIYESESLSESDYTDWEVEAMNYLASNEVNLESLLFEN